MTIDAVKLVDLVQRGDQGLKELIVDIPGLGITNPYALADLIALNNKSRSSSPNLPKPLKRSKLKNLAVQFHNKAGTLTEGVLSNLEHFSNRAPILRIVHQANTFPSLNVFCQFIFLNLVAQRLQSKHGVSTCLVYLVVDHDAAEDRRFRVSHFPDVKRREGSLVLSSTIPPSLRQKLNMAIEKPSREKIDEWISSLNILVRESLSILRSAGITETETGQIGKRLKVIEQEILESYNRSSSLSEFNAILMSRIVNLHWNIPILFLSSTQLTKEAKKYYQYLLQHYPEMVKSANEIVDLFQFRGVELPNSLRPQLHIFPLWYVCQLCFVRVPLKVISEAKLDVTGECPVCRSKYQFDLGTFSAPELDPIWDKMAPRVLFNDLIDLVGLRITGGAGYVSNAEHVLVSSLVAAKLGWNVPLECLWRTRGIYFGSAECEAALILAREANQNIAADVNHVLQQVFFGRASILYYTLAQGLDGLMQIWNRHFENGGQVYEVNVSKGPFEISEDLGVLLEEKMRLFNPNNTIDDSS